MKKIIRLNLIVIVGLHLLPKIVFSQAKTKLTTDYSSVDAFYEIVEKIKNENITEKDWDYLFSTPYYNFYKNWGQRKGIQNTLITAFSLAKQLERDSLIKINNYKSEVLKRLLFADKNKAQLQVFRRNLIARDIGNKILLKAKNFLPVDINLQIINQPPIFFGIFQPDANASETGIAVDLKLAMDYVDPVELIAHEAHHFFIYNYSKKFKEINNDSTSLLMHSISQLQLEGIADLIDKSNIDKDDFGKSKKTGLSPNIIEVYRKAYSNPLTNLKKIDSLLVAISKNPLGTELNSKTIADLLPLGGHPHGFYMAKAILKVYGKNTLINTLGNPFEFIKIYNKASKKLAGMATFSSESMKTLEQIESSHSF